MSSDQPPLHAVLAGIETEYGFTVEGSGPEMQVDLATDFVSQLKTGFAGWDYRAESPRTDLRGFQVDRLAVDPTDAAFDEGRARGRDADTRADRVLANGARYYNDHGHPEFATPECWNRTQLMVQDKAGELVLMQSAQSLQQKLGREVKVYKNNTDFHGASYGCHESYLVPRRLSFAELYRAITPMLIARILLTGAGKAGSESGAACGFQLSARADFFSESANVETLYRRPVFNTRDEPHADPSLWQRLHVISGDANMIPTCTSRKVGLVQLAVSLATAGVAPHWKIEDPVQAIQTLSRTLEPPFEVPLSRHQTTTAGEILESYFAAWEKLGMPPTSETEGEIPSADYGSLIAECRLHLSQLDRKDSSVNAHIDWCAKLHLLEMVRAESGFAWGDPRLQSYDLEYHNINPDEGLYFALVEMGEAPEYPPLEERLQCLHEPAERSRAWVRGLAVKNFSDSLVTASWSRLVFQVGEGEPVVVPLDPDKVYDRELATISSVGNFISCLKS